MSSKVNDDGEFSINMQYSISHFTNINNSQKPIKFYLFRKQEEEIQNINDQIFKQTDKSVLRKIMKILMEIYSCMKPGSNYSDDESIIGKFLFNLRIEIDVPQLEISHILLPIAFKKYLTLKNTQYKREQYRELFHIIRRAYAVKQEDLDTQDIELSTYNFYKLLPHISSKTFHSSKKANIKLIQIIQNQNNQYGTLIKSIQNIYKVKYMKFLIKQQNQEIIISKCSNSLLPLGKDNIIYYNQKSDIKLSQTYNKRILYIGQLNYNYELLGEGIFKQIDLNIIYDGQFDQGLQNGEGKQIFLKNQYEGIFNQGQKQGCFIVTKLESQNSYYCQFENDVVAFKIQDKQHFNQLKQQQLLCEKKILEKDIVHVKEYYLSTKIINTLKIGSWLQDGIIDWYLMELKNHYKQLHLDKVNYTLFNVMNSQDVFSSQLNYENFDFTQVEKFINLPFLQKQVEKSKTAQTGTFAKRTIFAMNLNRQHFITIVIDNNQIYFLNSLQSDLSNFGKILKESYLKIGLEIHYHPDNQIQIIQQKNFYSCGVHTCYVIHQLIKHYNVPIKDIQFNNTEAKIEKYTIHMRNVIFTKNSIHIEAQTL